MDDVHITMGSKYLFCLRNRAPEVVMGWYTKGTDMPTKPEGHGPWLEVL